MVLALMPRTPVLRPCHMILFPLLVLIQTELLAELDPKLDDLRAAKQGSRHEAGLAHLAEGRIPEVARFGSEGGYGVGG